MEDNAFKINHDYQAVIGDYPKVVIRPAIDGREKGIREFLEQQTMGTAQNDANMIPRNLRYSNGKPVECVIADICIGGVNEAAMCAEKFRKNGVGYSMKGLSAFGMEKEGADYRACLVYGPLYK